MKYVAIMAALAGSPVMAQQSCAPREVLVERLASGYGESQQVIGLGSSGALVEMFASTETGTWTITITQPGGLTCLAAAGGSYQHVGEPPQPLGEEG